MEKVEDKEVGKEIEDMEKEEEVEEKEVEEQQEEVEKDEEERRWRRRSVLTTSLFLRISAYQRSGNPRSGLPVVPKHPMALES